MKGLTIREGTFLGVKQYGYQYIDNNNNIVTKTVFAGITRDSLTYDNIKHLLSGGEITIKNKDRFIRTLSKFTIHIRESVTIIKQNNNKKLVNNKI